MHFIWFFFFTRLNLTPFPYFDSMFFFFSAEAFTILVEYLYVRCSCHSDILFLVPYWLFIRVSVFCSSSHNQKPSTHTLSRSSLLLVLIFETLVVGFMPSGIVGHICTKKSVHAYPRTYSCGPNEFEINICPRYSLSPSECLTHNQSDGKITLHHMEILMYFCTKSSWNSLVFKDMHRCSLNFLILFFMWNKK